MSEDENYPEDPERNRQGRWRKGVSGNPNGRPRKGPRADMSDSYVFGHTLVEIEANGRRERRPRSQLIREKVFQTAMKGDVRAQIYCDKIIKEGKEAFAWASLRYQELQVLLLKMKPDEIPLKIELEMAQLGGFLGINEREKREAEAGFRLQMREARRKKMREAQGKK